MNGSPAVHACATVSYSWDDIEYCRHGLGGSVRYRASSDHVYQTVFYPLVIRSIAGPKANGHQENNIMAPRAREAELFVMSICTPCRPERHGQTIPFSALTFLSNSYRVSLGFLLGYV